MTDATPHIGTLGEKPLHAALKNWYAEPDDLIEQPVDGYVIDLVRDELLIEIQTGGFAPMKKKIGALLGSGHQVRIVAPIAVDKWIMKMSNDGEILDRRLSPKHGDVIDVFGLLVSFPDLVVTDHLEVEVVLTNQEELRVHEPGKAWRRKGWVVQERRLVDVVDTSLLQGGDDLLSLLPEDLPEPFSTADLAQSAGCPRRTAQQVAYCLREAGLVEIAGKKGNALLYESAET